VTSPTSRSADPTRRRPQRRPGRWCRRVTSTATLTTAGALLLLGAPVATSGTAGPAPAADTSDTGLSLVAADSHRWPGHPGRKVIRYTVRPGDTATGLSVRFHAWTAELRAINHLSRSSSLYVGERIRIPVVLAALHKAHRHGRHTQHPKRVAKRHVAARHVAKKPAAAPKRAHVRPWALADVSQGKVRRVVVRTARRYGVNPDLALAIAWQESGWQQRRISPARAIGVMQVLPGTAQWMSSYAGRPLNPYGLYDNVTAGVVLIKVLKTQTDPPKAVASYYQGLGSVREHGMHRSTKAYVRNVVSLRKRIAAGWSPI
jgi:LysM repeat protein